MPHCFIVADGVEIRVLIWRAEQRSEERPKGPLALLVLLEVVDVVVLVVVFVVCA